MFNSPNFEATHQEERRPWWAVFGHSLKAVLNNMYAPFENATTFLLSHWQNTGQDSKSDPEIDGLVALLLDPRFNIKDLEGFRAQRERQRVDDFTEAPFGTNALFSPDDGWIESTVTLQLPCKGWKIREELAPSFNVNGVFFRKPLKVIKAAL